MEQWKNEINSSFQDLVVNHLLDSYEPSLELRDTFRTNPTDLLEGSYVLIIINPNNW